MALIRDWLEVVSVLELSLCMEPVASVFKEGIVTFELVVRVGRHVRILKFEGQDYILRSYSFGCIYVLHRTDVIAAAAQRHG